MQSGGHNWPTSEAPFQWLYVWSPIVAHFYMLMAMDTVAKDTVAKDMVAKDMVDMNLPDDKLPWHIWINCKLFAKDTVAKDTVDMNLPDDKIPWDKRQLLQRNTYSWQISALLNL